MKLRDNRLCCILNTTFRCTLCKAVMCDECNNIDIVYVNKCREDNRERIDLNTLGHLSKKCLKSEDTAYGWIDVHAV